MGNTNENEFMVDYETVVLEMEDGSTADFAIVDEFEVEDKKYALLIEFEGDLLLDDADHAMFMEVATDEDCAEDEIILNVIESDDEYNKIVDFYNNLIEE